MRKFIIIFMVLSAIAADNMAIGAVPRWQTLPPTPTLPAALRQGYAPVNGIRIWYAVFGHGAPVIMLHGGLANANYWGLQVPVLARHYRVIVMDSRGHGRSSRDERPYSYNLMADDVIGLMDFLKFHKAAIVGWSDGGIIGLDLTMRYPSRISKVFAFAANINPNGLVDGVEKTPTFSAYIARAGREYAKLSPTPKRYTEFLGAINQMWETQPNYTAEQLATIRVPVLIVDADHDEAVKRQHTEAIAAEIPGAGLLIQPNVSHFSFLQDSTQFTEDIMNFLAR